MPSSEPLPLKIIECPRDAMQGWKSFIPTKIKIEYINALLQVGFDTIDFGSFVSPKVIPQMADTKEVMRGLQPVNGQSKLLTIVANYTGAQDAMVYDTISYLGFPFSVSPTFQRRNTNSSMEESIGRVEEMQELCVNNNKELVVYLSMAFGNPYGDPYSEEILFRWMEKIVALEVHTISIADTVGLAEPSQVLQILRKLILANPGIEIGVHLHSSPFNSEQKLAAAMEAGCSRFDGALNGIGGCPMAKDELVGNMDTIGMIRYFERLGRAPLINKQALENALLIAARVFI